MADKQERTEDASPRKREEARQQGQLPRSQEIPMALGLLAALLTLRASAGATFRWLERMTEHYMRLAGQWVGEDLSIVRIEAMGWHGFQLLWAVVAPLFVVLVVVGIASNVLQTGPFFSLKPLAPKPSRISLSRGLGVFFSTRSVAEAVKSLLKVVVLSFLASQILASELPTILGLAQSGWEVVLVLMARLAYRLTLVMVIAFVVLAILDFVYQRWQYNQNLKMSKEEVKEETKQYEGDPQVKARIRSIQRDLARRRMMKEVPKATVVITNPHELAVALRYERETMQAPQVVAKGARLVAQRIKEIAREARVPIVEDQPLARALYKEVPVGGEITSNFYRAVAEILAYVYRLRQAYWWRHGTGTVARPEPRGRQEDALASVGD
jgi:flagellar biosynthetic protein FlhB